MIKPVRNNLLVREVEKETTTASGLIISGDVETGLKPALVVAVGPEADCFYVDNKVFIPWDKAKPVSDNGIQMAIISEEEVLGVLT